MIGITREIHEAVCFSNCGKRIMANGFAAFWAFQALGNDPSMYDEKFISKIIDYLEKRGKANADERKEFENFIGRENKSFQHKEIFLHLDIWEDFIDAIQSALNEVADEYLNLGQETKHE